MNFEIAGFRGTIDLSQVEPFRLGRIEVQPATRQVICDGDAVTLEPRVMKVLVALAQREGQVVSRDELVDRCWNFRAIGDNAIQRAVSRVRELGAASGVDNFRIETISKVGYKLICQAGCEPSLGPSQRRTGTRRRLALIAAIAAALAIALYFYLGNPWTGSDRKLIVASERNDPLTSSVAAILSLEATGRDPQLLFKSDGSGSTVFKFRVDPVPAAGKVRVLLSTDRNELLWETAVRSAPPEVLKERIAASLGVVLLCGRQLLGGERAFDSSAWRLAFAVCSQLDAYPDERGLLYLRSLAQSAPNSSPLWALLAHHEALMAGTKMSESATRSLKSAAKRHAERAIALQSSNPLAYAVLAQLIDPPDWKAKIQLEERANSIENGSSTASLLHARSLQSVGRLSEAKQTMSQAVNLDPFSAPAQAALIEILADSGRTNEARAELRKAVRIWPSSPAIEYAKNRFEFRYGAEKALSDAQIEKLGAHSEAAEVQLQLYLSSKDVRSAQQADGAVASSSRILDRNRDVPFLHLQLLAKLGRTDEAYRILNDDVALRALQKSPYILFRPHMRSLWRDPRFMTLAARIGLVEYWMSTQAWPDFCREPSVTYECREEAEKASLSLG